MEGVTILAQEAVRDFDYGLCIGATLAFAMLFLFITVLTFDINSVGGTVIAVIISIAIGFGGGFISGRFANDPIPQYKVTISEEVSMVEFYEKYEIIDQEDMIFTVREKDQN